MSNYSVYPIAVDGYAQIPLVVDNQTHVNAITVNRLRSAIINIETELGVNPSGNYETVRARLDDLEQQIDAIYEATDIPPLIGQQYAVFMENPIGQADWQCLRPSFLCPDFEISSFSLSSNLIEVGDTLLNPTFTVTYTSDPVEVLIVDDDGGLEQDFSLSPNSFSYLDSYTKNTYGASVTWTLSVSDNVQTDTAQVTKTWTQLVFWGVGAAGGNSEAFIESLANSALATSKNRTFSVTANSSQKIYYAYRTAYGTATFTVGGFEGGFSLVSSSISVTNSFGFTENYTLYESDNVGLGSTTVVVS